MFTLYIFGMINVFLYGSYDSLDECLLYKQRLTTAKVAEHFNLECIKIDETNTS